MLRKIAIAVAAASLFGVASVPTDALAFGHGGGGGGHGGFGGGGFGHGGVVGGGFFSWFSRVGGGAPSFSAPRAVGGAPTLSSRGFVCRGCLPRASPLPFPPSLRAL